MKSCIFEGRVSHRRRAPVEHAFEYRIFMLYLDLAELDRVFDGRWLWSVDGATIAKFRRRDHLGDPERPLDECVRDLVENSTGRRPDGPIRLLTQLAYFGYGFTPVSFYYCFDSDDRRVESIVTEVNNTPWGEQYCYVSEERDNTGTDTLKRYELKKEFHVSPFMGMNLDYEWRFTEPAEALSVYMQNREDGERFFDATLALERSEINGYALARVLATYPLTTLRTVIGIYWQALWLWMKRCPVYDHPGREGPTTAKSSTLVEPQ